MQRNVRKNSAKNSAAVALQASSNITPNWAKYRKIYAVFSDYKQS